MTREEEIADLVFEIKRLSVERDARETQRYYALRYRLQLALASEERGSIRYSNPITHAHVSAADELLKT